jgi:hypothetical protein
LYLETNDATLLAGSASSDWRLIPGKAPLAVKWSDAGPIIAVGKTAPDPTDTVIVAEI